MLKVTHSIHTHMELLTKHPMVLSTGLVLFFVLLMMFGAALFEIDQEQSTQLGRSVIHYRFFQ